MSSQHNMIAQAWDPTNDPSWDPLAHVEQLSNPTPNQELEALIVSGNEQELPKFDHSLTPNQQQQELRMAFAMACDNNKLRRIMDRIIQGLNPGDTGAICPTCFKQYTPHEVALLETHRVQRPEGTVCVTLPR